MHGITFPSQNVTPIVVGVTGHRDLVDGEVAALERRVAAFFVELQADFPDTPVRVMTALAEGADRLVAKVAIEAGLQVQAVLPMPAEDYMQDFESSASRDEFTALCRQSEVLTLPVTTTAADEWRQKGHARDVCYANAGMYISAHCHILLAIWDGVQSEGVGGTSQVVYFQHYDRLPGLAESVPRSSLFLTDDESDLVYHISCSRRNAAGSPDRMAPLQCHWFTADPDSPRVESMPKRYVGVFSRMNAFNKDVHRFAARISEHTSSEATPPDTLIYGAAMRVRDAFDVADVLANHFQRRVDMTHVIIYTLAFLTGFAFILYSELNANDSFIYAFIGFLLLGVLIANIATRREWHRKYLDYRVLAEGLRVQFYRAIAGIQGAGHTKFAYDNFLRQRDMDLGWVRNVMRVAGTLSDSLPVDKESTGLRFAMDHWIGSPNSPGQLDYYQRKAAQRSTISRTIGFLTLGCLWAGIALAIFLALFLQGIGSGMRDPLIALMGVLPLIAGIAEVYSQKKGDRELTKQYQFMAIVFRNARRRLDEASSDSERREILLGLGDAALSEHAEWILVHRERQPEPGGL